MSWQRQDEAGFFFSRTSTGTYLHRGDKRGLGEPGELAFIFTIHDLGLDRKKSEITDNEASTSVVPCKE